MADLLCRPDFVDLGPCGEIFFELRGLGFDEAMESQKNFPISVTICSGRKVVNSKLKMLIHFICRVGMAGGFLVRDNDGP